MKEVIPSNLVREGGLEPPRLRIRPSNVRVYQFHHSRLIRMDHYI